MGRRVGFAVVTENRVVGIPMEFGDRVTDCARREILIERDYDPLLFHRNAHDLGVGDTRRGLANLQDVMAAITQPLDSFAGEVFVGEDSHQTACAG